MTGSQRTPETKGMTQRRSTLTPHGTTSGAAWIASAPAAIQSEFLEGLSLNEVRALPYLFDFWAHEHQLPPEGAWRSWVVLGGRGAGKTRAGAEWVRAQVEGAGPFDKGAMSRVALVGETIDQVREVMIFGESGIMACCPPDRQPVWLSTRKMLVWPNGATARVYSAHDPDQLRGPQFDCAWVDELAKWKKGQDAWDNLQLCLRLGSDPRVCVTTTPKNVPVLKDLLAQETTVTTQAPTKANRANLADGFLAEVQRLYAGTRKGREELDGALLAEIDGALWTPALIDDARVEKLPELERVVVAVDPPATGKGSSDDCGIIVVGVTMQGTPDQWRAYVIEDATVSAASPLAWARAAVAAVERHGADRLVAEINQGGDMVEAVVRQVSSFVPYKGLRASRGKGLRAEPVAALYEQGRVKHVRGLSDLEEQMEQMTVHGFEGKGSPDRVDALVWALHEAMVEPAQSWQRPRLRAL